MLARLPLGMTPLAVLLLVQGATGSFASAGAVTGMFALMSALSSPVRGRLVDRLGARRVLLATGVLQPVSLVVLVFGATHDPVVSRAVFAAAGFAGALLPPVGPVVRVLWRGLPTAALQDSALAADSVALQVVYYAAGPPLVAVLVTRVSPAFSVLVIAGLTLVGVIAVVAAPDLGAWQRQARRGMLGALSTPGLVLVLAVVVLTAAAIGALEVAVAGFAVHRGSGNASGVLLGIFGLGSVIGGLRYGARPSLRPRLRYSRALAALTAGLVLPVLAPGVLILAGLLLVTGLAAAASSIVQFATVGRLAPRPVLTEAFTWLLSASQAGAAAGTAAAGAAVQALGARDALILPVLLASLAWGTWAALGGQRMPATGPSSR